MRSTGNDIVALEAIDAHRTSQPRFYKKILAPQEEGLFKGLPGDLSFERFVWLLWSVKESAYKYLRRLEPDLLFSPPKMIIRQIKFVAADFRYDCTITPGSTGLYARSVIGEGAIATVVSEDETFEGVYWEIGRTNDIGHAGQSAAVRALALNKLRNTLGSNLRIVKNEAGIPSLLVGAGEKRFPISLAHHGPFIAYSLSSRDVAG